MNKMFKRLCVIAVTTALAIGCGGGDKKDGTTAATQSKKIELKENGILGMLPALYVEYIVSSGAARQEFEKKVEEEIEKMGDYVDHDALALIHDAHEKAEDEKSEKLAVAVNAEWEKVSGNDVPFTMSDAFKELKLDVSPVKVNGADQNINLTVTAGENLTINWDNNRYKQIWYNVLASDGSIITEGAVLLVHVEHKGSASFAKGQNITSSVDGVEVSGNLDLLKNTEAWMNFASIKFIDESERVQKKRPGTVPGGGATVLGQ